MADNKSKAHDVSAEDSASVASKPRLSKMQSYLLRVIPTAALYQQAGLPIEPEDAPDVTVYENALAEVQMTSADALDPVRVRIAVQRVVVAVVKQLLQRDPALSAPHLQGKATALIPIITEQICNR